MLKETKRTLALVLALIMMFGTFSGSLGMAAYADEPETEEEQVLLEYPEFRQSAFIDWEFEAEAAKRAEQGEDFVNEGLHLALSAPEGVFPEGSELKVALRDYADVNLSVSKVREAGYNVREKYCFQVGVYGADGETYISPDTKGNKVPVTVTIGIDELPGSAGYSKVSLYRTSNIDGRSEVLFSDKELKGNAVTAEAYGLGYWTLEFEYLLTYRLNVNEEVLLKDICDYLHLKGTPSQVISTAPGLFTVTQNEDGEYVVKALSAFGGAELELWYDGVKYSVMLDAVPGAAPAEEEEAEEAEETEETEEAAEEGYRITFTASEGGKVAFAPETGAEAELKDGLEQRIKATSDLKDVIAVADEGYTFKAWMYKGEKFHEGETFTWANVPMLEDSGFVAAFVKTYYEATTESGVTVSVTAPVGAFPEGTVMKVRDIEADDEVLDAVKSAVADGSVVRKVQAVDISFWAGGVEIEPNGKIQVKITSDLIREASTPQIVHVPDAEDADSEAKVMATDPVADNSDEMSFESDRFSTYVVAEVLETEHIDAFGNVYDVIVTYTEEAKIPADSKVVVKEYAEDSDEYISAREKVIADKKAKGEETDPETLNLAVLDISIEGPDGAKIEPGESVHVDLKIKSLPEVEDLAQVTGTIEVRHLNERSGEVETVASAGEVEIIDSAAAAEFDIDSFSKFTLTWTNAEGGEEKATIHWGTLDGNDFEEFDSTTTIDTTASSVDLAVNIDGYYYTGAKYKTNESEVVLADSVIRKDADGKWKVVTVTYDDDGNVTGSEVTVADGSDIYVYYAEKGGGGYNPPGPPPATLDDITPDTEKSVTSNNDGTYKIRLDVTGHATEDVKQGANVLVMLDMTYSMQQNDMNGTRIAAAKRALLTLIDALDPGYDAQHPDLNLVNFALYTFGNTMNVTQELSWTQNRNDMESAVRGLSNSPNALGTNWQGGLQGAERVAEAANRDDELGKNPTYVIFVTDGAPNCWQGHTTSSQGNDLDPAALPYAQNAANSLTDDAILYGVFCGPASGYNNLATMVNNAQGAATINGASAAAMEAAFSQIAGKIVEGMSAGNVTVDDGIPSLSNVSANVTAGEAGGFTYYITPADDSEHSWTGPIEGVVEVGPPGATYDKSNGVTWDLGEAGTLQEGWVYSIEFTVWPSQEAYDTIADLNNGVITMDDDELEAAGIAKPAGEGQPYTLKTNTHLNTTFTDPSGQVYDVVEQHVVSEAMDLPTETIGVKKIWNNFLDQQNPPDGVELVLTKDGANYLYGDHAIEVSSDTGWEADDIYISLGQIKKTASGYEILETGHDYEIVETPDYEGNYRWELTSEVYRPMVINGTATMLILDDTVEGEDGTDYYTIGSHKYKVSEGEGNTLKAWNDRRSWLQIEKKVTGTGAPADALFEFTVTIEDANEDDIWYSAYGPDGIVMELETNGTPEVKEGSKTGSFYASSGSAITVKIKAGWTLRFLNLPSGTTYTIEETNLPDGFAFVKAEGRQKVDTEVQQDDPAKPKVGLTTTGTINVPNVEFYVDYTNKYEETAIEVTKVWVDGNDQDKIRPSADAYKSDISLLVNGTASTKYTPTVTDNGDNTYTITYTGLPKYIDNEEAEYKVKETTVPEGYEVDGSDVAADKGTITNKHEPTTVDITVTKVWDDSNDQDGIRPESVEVKLYVGETAVAGAEALKLNESSEWKGTWTGLPEKANGEAIAYTVKETTTSVITGTDGPGTYAYKVSGSVTDGFTVTNTHTPEKANLKVTKTWDDANNQDGKRPASITVTLSNDDEITLNARNNWTYTWEDLPVYANGQKITYSVTESEVASYTATYDPANGTTLTAGETAQLGIKNSYTPEVTEVKAEKVWDDADNQDGKRNDVTFNLLADGEAVSGQSKTISKTATGDALKVTWTGLPVYKDGTEIVYTVEEDGVRNGKITMNGAEYTVTVTGDAEKGFTITNSYTPEVTSVSATKVWDDNDNQDGKRDNVTFNLLADGTAVSGQSKTISKTATGEDLTVTWTELPVYKEGTKIVYTVEEDGVRNGKITMNGAEYTVTVAGNAESGFKITNKHTPEVTEVKAEKVWDDNNNQAGKRNDVTFNLLADGEAVSGQSKTISKTATGDGLKVTWTKLPVYKDGTEIVYTVEEDGVTDGKITMNGVEYTVTVEGDAEKGFKITNTFIPATAEVSLTKTVDKGSPAAKTFSFTIAAESGPDGVDVPMPSSTLGTASFGANETGSKPISFGNITYTAPGTYKYKVTEAAPGAGWTADGSPAMVTVTVTAEGGKLTAEVSKATITNSYKVDPVVVDPPVQKIIVNNDKLYNKGDFTFTIENTEAVDPTGAPIKNVPMPDNTSITNSPDYELENRKGFYEFGNITFTEPGTYTYTVTESGSVEGVTNDPDAEKGKSITFTVTDDGSGTLKVTPKTDQAQFTFTNTYKSEGHVPKTDDNTNLDKWGIGAAICAAGFAGVKLIDAIVKKRKKEDEAK